MNFERDSPQKRNEILKPLDQSQTFVCVIVDSFPFVVFGNQTETLKCRRSIVFVRFISLEDLTLLGRR
jgi:hypothetical protein